MNGISFQEFEHNPAATIDRIEAGETLRVVRGGRVVAELRPVAPPSAGLRPIGLCAGEFSVPDDFDSPLSEETLQEFEGT